MSEYIYRLNEGYVIADEGYSLAYHGIDWGEEPITLKHLDELEKSLKEQLVLVAEVRAALSSTDNSDD